MRGGLDRFLETGPLHPVVPTVASPASRPRTGLVDDPAIAVQESFRKAREHFLTQEGEPRKLLPPRYKKAMFASAADWQTHKDLVVGHASAILDAHKAWRRDLNVLVSRGVWRMFRIAENEYRRTLDSRALLDFPDVLLKTIELLRADGGVRAESLPPGIAVSPCPGRRVSGYESCAVGARVAARAGVG